MSDLDNSPSLLPRGFEDLLPPDAEAEFRAIGVLMKTFGAHGYARVKPPLAEFEESLLSAGPGAGMAEKTFRVMDPLSDKMLALRSDITAQIARVASSRLHDAPRPLRLTYANDVLRTRASQERTLRQFCQVGCELISTQSAQADLEICTLALIGLSSLGISDITLDFCVPGLVAALFDAAGVSDDEREALKAALDKRDEQGLKAAAGDEGLSASLITLLRVGGPAEKALSALEGADLPDSAQSYIARLKEIIGVLMGSIETLGLDVSLTIDPAETKGFEYHCGVCFTLFAKGARGELGRGGRYDVVCTKSNTEESASGFTLYMDSVRLAMPALPQKEVKEVSADTGWDEIRALQEQGFIVKRGL